MNRTAKYIIVSVLCLLPNICHAFLLNPGGGGSPSGDFTPGGNITAGGNVSAGGSVTAPGGFYGPATGLTQIPSTVPNAAAYEFGTTSPALSTETINEQDGTFYYEDLTVPAGGTLTVSARGRALILYVRGTCLVEGTIDMSGKGEQGGIGSTGAPPGGSASDGETPQTRSNALDTEHLFVLGGTGGDGGDGASSGASGGGPTTTGHDGITLAATRYAGDQDKGKYQPYYFGSGGGGGGGGDDGGAGQGSGGDGGAGGDGGGALIIYAKTFINNGTITANGKNGEDATDGESTNGGGGGGGGGGSGGYIKIVADNYTNNGTISAAGGTGGFGGAGDGSGQPGSAGTSGAGGFIIIDDKPVETLQATGDVWQTVQTIPGTVTTVTSVIPFTSDAPGISNGTTILYQPITMNSSNNNNDIKAVVHCSPSITDHVTLALFEGTTLQKTVTETVIAGHVKALTLEYTDMTPAATTTVYKINLGLASPGGTITVNGIGGVLKSNGNMLTGIRVREVVPR